MALPARTRAAGAAPGARKEAPDFKLRSSSSGRLALSGYKGKAVLLDFWATWCGGCRIEIPWYVEFEDRYGKSGLAVIGISICDGRKTVEPSLAAEKVDYPAVIGSVGLL